MKALLRVRNSPLARNTFWMLLGQGARIPIQAVYFLLIARALGAQGYGAFIGVTALIGILAPFSGMGSGNLLVKNVSRDESCFRIYWGKALLLTLLSGSALLTIALLFSGLLLPDSIPFPLILSVALADLLCARFHDAATLAFQAFQKIGKMSQLVVLPNLTRLLMLLLLLALVESPSATLWGYFYLAAILLSALVGMVMVSRELGLPIVQRKQLTDELKEGIYFSLSLSSQNIYNDLDKMMLAKLATLEAAGIYGAAYRMVDVAFTPVRSLLCASYARFFQYGAGGMRESLGFAAKLLPAATMYGLAVSALLFASAPLLPYLLGPEYAETVVALRWLSLLPVLKVLHYFAADSLSGAGHQGARSICQILTAIVNVALVLWLIPLYSWKGAAWASLASDLLLVLGMWGLALWARRNEPVPAASSAPAQAR
jgi:O-antigen/teichoic acid export membrane protein